MSCSVVGVTLFGCVALLEEVCHCWGRPVWGSLLLPADQDVELSAPSPVPGLPAGRHASHHDDNGLNL
ncbi:hypothetical protein LEMLEM_LOCUS2742 [Lemmus lemmus]